jgi:hypothetical protein
MILNVNGNRYEVQNEMWTLLEVLRDLQVFSLVRVYTAPKPNQVPPTCG